MCNNSKHYTSNALYSLHKHLTSYKKENKKREEKKK
ncbi:hypothetical protein E2C01_014125 [Portunus trituberculatus]|uniref:Uncharacterized protein n=1 Tax=Portunus trituberculatus TaxID=210409 RepID=A0A5B7DID0_PORTR|nr:hypothetical protein [Portunus trituberculatus]